MKAADEPAVSTVQWHLSTWRFRSTLPIFMTRGFNLRTRNLVSEIDSTKNRFRRYSRHRIKLGAYEDKDWLFTYRHPVVT